MADATLTYDKLVEMRAYMAELINAHGETYWPLFQRLDDACRERETRAQRLAAAKLPAAHTLNAKQGDQIIRERQRNLA